MLIYLADGAVYNIVSDGSELIGAIATTTFIFQTEFIMRK